MNTVCIVCFLIIIIIIISAMNSKFSGYYILVMFLCVNSNNDYFSLLSLGESIAANNAYRQREGELIVRGSGVQDDGVTSVKNVSLSNAAPNSPSGQSIDSLIEKLQSGIQVCASITMHFF